MALPNNSEMKENVFFNELPVATTYNRDDMLSIFYDNIINCNNKLISKKKAI